MKKINTRGFTLLLAVLITGIVLGISIGFPIFVLKELVISVTGRESQKAFFAADSGIECVLYWDLKQNAFATTTVTSNISCAGSNINLHPKADYAAGQPTSFNLSFANGACSYVKVDKTTYPQTKIDSYGHNTCNLSDPNRVERALEVVY